MCLFECAPQILSRSGPGGPEITHRRHGPYRRTYSVLYTIDYIIYSMCYTMLYYTIL